MFGVSFCLLFERKSIFLQHGCIRLIKSNSIYDDVTKDFGSFETPKNKQLF